MPFFTSKTIVNKKHERRELAEFYGVPEETMAFDVNNLTLEQIEGMRAVIAQHDKNAQPNVFDLSKPPVKPYVYQKFPMAVYDHRKSRAAFDRETKTALGEPRIEHISAHLATKIVHSEDELKSALAKGYETKPPVFVEEDDDIDRQAFQAQKYVPEEVALLEEEVADVETVPARKRR